MEFKSELNLHSIRTVMQNKVALDQFEVVVLRRNCL